MRSRLIRANGEGLSTTPDTPTPQLSSSKPTLPSDDTIALGNTVSAAAAMILTPSAVSNCGQFASSLRPLYCELTTSFLYFATHAQGGNGASRAPNTRQIRRLHRFHPGLRAGRVPAARRGSRWRPGRIAESGWHRCAGPGSAGPPYLLRRDDPAARGQRQQARVRGPRVATVRLPGHQHPRTSCDDRPAFGDGRGLPQGDRDLLLCPCKRRRGAARSRRTRVAAT